MFYVTDGPRISLCRNPVWAPVASICRELSCLELTSVWPYAGSLTCRWRTCRRWWRRWNGCWSPRVASGTRRRPSPASVWRSHWRRPTACRWCWNSGRSPWTRPHPAQPSPRPPSSTSSVSLHYSKAIYPPQPSLASLVGVLMSILISWWKFRKYSPS